MVCLLRTDRRIIATLCGTDGLTCSSFPYPIRTAYQAIGTHWTLIVRIPERYIYRKHQENYGTECRKIENFIAHTIPDLVNVLATVTLMFIIFFSLNGWMAAICLFCIALSIGLQFANFFGEKAQEFTKIYFDTQERMSASAVQYVRGMPVVKKSSVRASGHSAVSIVRLRRIRNMHWKYVIHTNPVWWSSPYYWTHLLRSFCR